MPDRGYTLHTNTDITPLQQLTEAVATCMRKHGIKRATGSTNDYRRALKIAQTEIKTSLGYELKERVYQWVLPKEV